MRESQNDKVDWVTPGISTVFIKINGELHYLWRAVDRDGDTIDILVQKRRNKAAAKRFFRKLLKSQHQPPWRIINKN